MAPLGTSMSISHDIFTLRFFYLQTDLTHTSFCCRIVVLCFCEKTLLPREPGARCTQNSISGQTSTTKLSSSSLLVSFPSSLLKKKTESTKYNKKRERCLRPKNRETSPTQKKLDNYVRWCFSLNDA